MLDDIDRALLHVLQRDGQVSYAELGSNVGFSASALSCVKEPRKIDTSVTGSG